jgi:polyisoprenoid-binding protein YceI
MTQLRFLRLALSALGVLSGGAYAQPKPPAKRALLRSGTLSFLGRATIAGDFVGSTNSVTGAAEGDLSDARGWVEAPVATLGTGNVHRDRDLRASLDATIHPVMRFDLVSTTTLAWAHDAADTVTLLLHGNLTVHGVTRNVDLPAVASCIADTIHITTAFPLDLAEYRVGGLTRMFGLLRMHRWVDVHVDLWFLISPSRQASDIR